MAAKLSYPRLAPTLYLALWSSVFAVWSFIDGAGVFAAFGLDMGGDPFVLQNSGARYLGIAAALWAAILVFRTKSAVLTALTARLTMDVFDVVAGARTGVIDPLLPGIAQSAAMFLIPALLGMYLAATAPQAADGAQAAQPS
ncbi:MAG: hypothetical protein MI723_07360 [Caulobacterales bacterium]|nr:hypothetical protein [Caulobacterales bacterium]